MTPKGQTAPLSGHGNRPPVVLHPHVGQVVAWAFSESGKPFVVRDAK